MAEHNSDAANEKTARFAIFPTEKVLLVIVAALVGSITATFQIGLTARTQRQQLQFDRQLEALKNFSGALNDYPKLLAKDEELEDFLAFRAGSPRPEDDFAEYQKLFRDSQFLRDQYIADLHTESVVMSSVFPTSFRVLDYPNLDLPYSSPSLMGKSKKELREMLRKNTTALRDGLRRNDSDIIKFVGLYETELERIAALLAR